MESCFENSLSILPEKCKKLLSNIKEVIEAYPFMKDVISTYLNSLSSKNNKNYSCIELSAENPSNTPKKKKIEICKTLANNNISQHCVAQEFVNKSECIDKKLCSKIPVVLLKRLSHAELTPNYIEYDVMKSSVNCIIKSNSFSKTLKTNEASCTTMNDLGITEELSSDILKEPLTETCSFSETPSNSKVNYEMFLPKTEASSMECILGHVTSDVYENVEGEMREDPFNITEDLASNEEADAISLYTNSISGSDLEEDDSVPKSNKVHLANDNILCNNDSNCDSVGFEHTDGQADQQPEAQINSVNDLIQQNVHQSENSTENVSMQSSQQFPAFKHVLRERRMETTFPKKLISLSNDSDSNKSTRRLRKRASRFRFTNRKSILEECMTSGAIENVPKVWFSEYCGQILSTGLKCKPRTCRLSHGRPEITAVEGEELIAVVSFAKQNNFDHFLSYSLPKLIRTVAKAKDCHLYNRLLKVLEICEYTGIEALEYIMKELNSVNGNKISQVFMDMLINSILKCDASANTWINFIHLSQKKGYIVHINVLIKVLHLCIVSSHRVLCTTVFKEFFQSPKYDLKEFPCDLIRKFSDTLLNLKLDGDFSLLDVRLEATTQPLQSNSLSQIESCNSEHNATCGFKNEMVLSPEYILGPTRMKFYKEMSEHFSSDLCNIDSILPELVSVNTNSELHKYYHILFLLKEDIKDKKFDNFIEILGDLQKIKHYLEIARELYVIWKSVHGFNSQPFYDLLSAVMNGRNIVDFIELILTTIGVNIMLEKYFNSSWSDAYSICKALLDKCLNPASAQVCHKKIISPCNIVLISCEICMAVDDLKNAVKLIQENGMFSPSGWSVKTVEGDLVMRAEVCEKLLELLILRQLYSIASLMMWRLWDCQPVCFEPIDLRKYCPSLLCGLLSQNMGSESEKLYLMTKNSVKYENITIRLLVVDALRRKKVLFARDVYTKGISLNVYPAIIVSKPVATTIISSWNVEEIQIALMIFFEKVAEFFQHCDDVNEFNIVIHIKRVEENYDSDPALHHMLKNDSDCHFTKNKIEEILFTKLIRPISWTSSSHRAIYLDKNSVFLYVKSFFMETVY